MPDWRNWFDKRNVTTPDTYVATCHMQSVVEYPARCVCRLTYFAILMHPDGSQYPVTGPYVDVPLESDTARFPQLCWTPELEAERDAARDELAKKILAEGWENMGVNGLFGMPRR